MEIKALRAYGYCYLNELQAKDVAKYIVIEKYLNSTVHIVQVILTWK